MSNGFTKTTIIDCPRSQSQEAITFNNSTPNIWTNRIGDGLRLMPGDQVSVHSSYISEIGAQSGEIQIKGFNLNQDQSVSQTETIDYLPVDYLPGTNALYKTENKNTSVQVRDDTLSLLFSPYKTANGENYMFLPRRYGSTGNASAWGYFDIRDGKAITFDMGATFLPQDDLNRCVADVAVIYSPYGASNVIPRSKLSGKNDNSRFTMYRSKETWFTSPNTPTTTVGGHAVNGSTVITIDHNSTTKNLLTDLLNASKRMSISAQSPITSFAGVVKILSFTDKTITLDTPATTTSGIHNQFTFSIPASGSNAWLPPTTLTVGADEAESLRDPALFNEYEQVRDLINLKANPGYNSPSDLATQLTEELNKRKDFEYPTGRFFNASTTASEIATVSVISETPAYKHYRSATHNNFKTTTYEDFWEKLDNSWNIASATQYLSAYHHVGIKRPEIYNSGLLMSKNASHVNLIYDQPGEGFSTDYERFNILGDRVFHTGMEWNEQNLLNIKQFLDSQEVYPEIFDDYKQSGIQVNASNFRLIHMNLYDNLNNPAHNASFGANIRSAKAPGFGYDLYNGSVSASQTSFPLFIDYNPNTAELNGDQVDFTTWSANGWVNGTLPPVTPNYNSLAYGFARKIRQEPIAGTEEVYYIGFQFEGTNDKIPEHFFHTNASYLDQVRHLPGAINASSQLGSGDGRQWGFDYHFSAYGTLAMILFNGNVNSQATSFDGLSIKAHAFAQQQDFGLQTHLDPWQYGIYLGADSPVINYDEVQQRFQIQSLHTAETVGNPVSAGRADTVIVPNNPDAAIKCYKINKRPLGNSYTPEVTPMNNTFSASFTRVPPEDSGRYTSANQCMTPYRIFDAHSGLFIENWVMPEHYWDESLVGIMGFRYNQFHNPNSLSSRQVRIKAFGSTDQLNNVNVITTNADVNEGDLIDYSKNLFSTDNFELANVVGLNGEFFNSGGRKQRNIVPAITVKNATSVKITGKRIPTKTLRPYYTIRSDIILENNYLGGDTSGITLPVVAITNKANPYGDFLNGIGGEIVFTNTMDRTITNIRCSVHEPDGSAARCDKNSSVIFKVDQQINADMSVVDTLLASKKKSDQIAAQEAEGDLPNTNNIKYSFD